MSTRLDMEGYYDGYWDSVTELGGVLAETVRNVEGRWLYRKDRQAIADIEAGLPPA